MDRRVIFLDVDGVLNSRATFLALKGQPLPRNHAICPAMVARLNEIVDATGAVCVLSSSWRYGFTATAFEELLRGFGFVGRIVDRTPLAPAYDAGQVVVMERIRGDEIQQWLDVNPGVSSFVILDDGDDMGDLVGRLVRTDFDEGLQSQHVESAIALLRGCP